MKKIIAMILSSLFIFAPALNAKAAPLLPAEPTEAELQAAADAVSYAVEHGYFQSADETAADDFTRAEWKSVLADWTRYIQPSLTAIGYVPGNADNDGDVAVDDSYILSRQEFSESMAVLLAQMEVGPPYALDVSIHAYRYRDWGAILPWYEDDVAFMAELGLMDYTYSNTNIGFASDGTTGLMFYPEKAITRAEAAQTLLAAETLVRQKERNWLIEKFGEENFLWISRINGKNVSASGFNVEVIVNDASKQINPHVIVAYTFDQTEAPTADNILSGRFYVQSQRLTEMRRVNTAPDATTYSVRFKGKPSANYNLYVILKDGAAYSNIVNYRINMPGK